MTQTKRAVLVCDADDMQCGAWDVDHYAEDAWDVNGVRITLAERAPGWTTVQAANGDEHYCPQHKTEATR